MTDVDLDLLADYADGLLDADRAAEVERLVATEPAWARTLTALTAAQPEVRSALAGLAAPPVPDDVVARLEAALSAAAGGADVVDLSQRRRDRRRRWSRAAAATAAVAAGVAVCIGGLTTAQNNTRSGTSSSAGSADQKAAAPMIGGPALLSSGRNYTPDTLSSLAAESAAAPGPAMNQAPSSARYAAGALASAPDGLDRLTDRTELQTCLGLIANAQQRTPTLVDYARYQDRPALVVILSGAGGREIVVVGSNCGLPGSGTDQIYAAPAR
jgi:hypothetical protein